ncbi:molybdenum ABC transporter ATP-binding protein [Oceanicoccus sagamiensis]|uniref:Molybdenum ABC transporter ATP-binding protein n=1 Tax=Oceanicoccus sagamiensis TaxID=716816 RepID=A0A1X9NCS3_9GAMM|nr:molybdenum ABC transporter ATP-binding protein [Oceanicoccus sagamiensis]ARN74222.1 molybdenum ABC transporter ATP-binding protein [Oceanicoccus sagamiensis]
MSLTIKLNLERDNFSLAIDTTLEAKGFTAIYGPSGAGKTTLLRWLAGLEPETQGQLSFNGTVWQDNDSALPPQQRHIAYVFQEPRLFPHLSVEGNLRYAYQRRFNPEGPSLQDVCDWLEIGKLIKQFPDQLSGGEQQRVAIARALLSSPELILMDEPLASLDGASKQRIIKHLQALQANMATPIIYVSHDFEEVSQLADQLLLIDKGQLIAQGPLLELSHRIDLPLSHEENAASIINATIEQHDRKNHLTELLIDNHLSLWITAIEGREDEPVRIRIPARDVSINLERAEHSSILNILPATITEIEQSDSSARVLIKLAVAHQFILVRLTHKSVTRLELSVGQQVYAQIKTVALLSDQREH